MRTVTPPSYFRDFWELILCYSMCQIREWSIELVPPSSARFLHWMRCISLRSNNRANFRSPGTLGEFQDDIALHIWLCNMNSQKCQHKWLWKWKWRRLTTDRSWKYKLEEMGNPYRHETNKHVIQQQRSRKFRRAIITGWSGSKLRRISRSTRYQSRSDDVYNKRRRNF